MDFQLCKSLLLSILVFVVGIPLQAFGGNVTVISSDRSGVSFDVRIDPSGLDSRPESDSLPGYYETFTVGIPSGARVDLIGAETRGETARMALQDAAKISSVARPLVEISEPFTVRGREMVLVRVNPVGPDGSCAGQVSVRLAFRGGVTDGVVEEDRWFERVFGPRVVNFEQFRTWPIAMPTAAKAGQVTGPFAGGGEWYKISVNQTGLCKIFGSQLASAGLALGGVAPEAIRLYSGGGSPLPYDNTIARPTFREVAVTVEDGGDGAFGPNDYVLFYAEGPDRWLYRPGVAATYQNNPYDDVNVYWLTVRGTGLRMGEESVDPANPYDTTITEFQRTIHLEQDNLLRKYYSGKILDYFIWYWTDETSLSLSIPTAGLITGRSAELLCTGRTYDPDFADPLEGYIEATVGGVRATPSVQNQFLCRFTVNNLVEGFNNVHLQMWGGSDIAPYLNHVELTYPSRLVASGTALDLPLRGMDDRPARLEIIDNFSSTLIGLRLDDPLMPVKLTGYTRGGSTVALTAQMTALGPNRFFFGDASGAFTPLSVARVEPVDLYAGGDQADAIIVTSRALEAALDEFVAFREAQGLDLRVVAVEDIMDNFAFGLYDPTAIRDYLKYAYENSPAPAPHTVLLVGDGNFDYLDQLGTGVTNIVPPYVRDGDESSSDDNYVYFGRYGVLDSDTSYITVPDRGLDMTVARWPVRTAAEINTIVAKSKAYESPSTFGSWRAKVTLVADDEHGGDYDNETFHVEIGAEPLDAAHIPRTMQREKIYLWDYPRVGRLKPSVNDAIVRTINEGTLVIDYIGHGNPDVWADERVFYRDADLPRLRNAERLPLFYAASCAIGFFDDPDREGMAEELLVYPDGGGIAVISAMRLVYASENATFNRKVFDIVLTADSLSMAEGLFLAKLERQYDGGSIPVPVTNDRSYLFFGDPFLRLGKPRLQLALDESPDSLTALGRTRVSGRVVDSEGMLYNADGTLSVEVYDSDRQKQFRLFNTNGTVISTVDYNLPGPTIYRGTATITDGEFDVEFVSPLDVGYGGAGARIMMYAEFASTDGVGTVDSLTVSGTVAPTTDSAGPRIVYSFPQVAGFADGGTVTPEDALEIELSDSSGINLAEGLGHGITLVIDEAAEEEIDLTGLFAGDQDDFTTGRLLYQLSELEPGRHTFKIKAWDNANNSSTVSFTAEVAASGGPALVDLLNYPNPMQESTRFSYRLTTAVARVSLEIFTLSGRKIRTLETYPTDPGYYDDIIWYGEDHTGDRVATGVYIYKATAYPSNGEPVESFGKVVVVN